MKGTEAAAGHLAPLVRRVWASRVPPDKSFLAADWELAEPTPLPSCWQQLTTTN